MNVAVAKTTTGATLDGTFAAARGRLPGAGPVTETRQRAFDTFAVNGLPTRRVEEWKYTDLRALMRDAKPLAGPPNAAAKQRAKNAGGLLAGIDSRRLLFVDGAFVPELSDLTPEAGLDIASLAAALARGDALVTAHVGKVIDTGDAAVALNTALMGDGAVIRVAAGTALKRPIHLIFAMSNDQPAATFTRSLVVIEKDARVSLFESHEGGAETQSNTALELVVGDGAQVDHLKITSTGAGLHISSLMAAIGSHCKFDSFAFTTGSAVVRNQLFVRFDGEGTKAGIRGATLLKGREHVDATLVLDHAAGGCESREVFKSVLDGESRGVFQGKIIVRPHAQKSDGKMMTQALLLSATAEADNKPELEIFADDVQCGHGATAGALDDDLKFYLMARGIPGQEAEALLIQAFVGEAIEAIAHEGVKEALMNAAIGWLKTRS